MIASSLLVITVAALIGGSAADLTVTCYVCSSTNNPIECAHSFFISLGITQQASCYCCTKSLTNGATSRDCVTSVFAAAVECVPTSTHQTCATNLCNAANRIVAPRHVTGLAVMAAAVGWLLAKKVFCG
jgi:hypothetical protein